jgi:outer membrane protein TolC
MFQQFLVVAMLTPAALPAQQAHQHPLDRIVAEALRESRTLDIERIAERRTAADARAARAMRFPSFSLDARYSEQAGTLDFGEIINPAFAALNEIRGTNDFPTDLSLTLPLAHETRMRVMQPVFDERIRGSVRLARQREIAQHEHRAAAARRLAAEVQIAYLSFAAARDGAAIYDATRDLVKENERVTQRLIEAGRATPDALFRARAERSNVEQQLADAREQTNAAARALNHLMGRPLDASVEVIPDSVLRFELGISEEAALTAALARREELAEFDAGIRAADAAVSLATAAFLPSVAVAVDYGAQGQEIRFDRDADYWVASVVASWRLSGRGGDAARRSAARADADAARVARRDLEARIRLEVRQAYAAALVARAAIATADDRLAAARRSFELVRRRYEEGVATHIEFLDARTQLTSAELNRTLTQHRWAIRYIHLERAAALRDID